MSGSESRGKIPLEREPLWHFNCNRYFTKNTHFGPNTITYPAHYRCHLWWHRTIFSRLWPWRLPGLYRSRVHRRLYWVMAGSQVRSAGDLCRNRWRKALPHRMGDNWFSALYTCCWIGAGRCFREKAWFVISLSRRGFSTNKLKIRKKSYCETPTFNRPYIVETKNDPVINGCKI